MNALANQMRSDESSLKHWSFVVECALADWILLTYEFSHHKQQSADIREI